MPAPLFAAKNGVHGGGDPRYGPGGFFFIAPEILDEYRQGIASAAREGDIGHIVVGYEFSVAVDVA